MTGALGKITSLLGGLVGEGSIARQFFVWGVLSEVVSSQIGPFVTALRSAANARHPLEPLSPADLAAMVLRNIIAKDEGVKQAAKSGVSAADFDRMIQNTGQPPALGDLLRLWREGKIDAATVEHGIRQSYIRDEWIPTIKQLAIVPPTHIDILNAYLEGQISEGNARTEFAKFGGDPAYFDLMFNSRGNAPTPVEAADMANRGLIPWDGSGAGAVSFEQAFLEGPWRNKWLKAFRAAAEYFPPPRTITAMYNEGALTRDRAIQLLLKQGLAPDLAAAYLVSASSQKTKKQRDLALSEITTLYEDQAITRTDAAGMLKQLGFDANEAEFILEITELRHIRKFTEAAISAVHTQYVNHKIDQNRASTTLDQIGLAAGERDNLIALWDLERGNKVALLTAAQIKTAMKKDKISYENALSRLLSMGYSEDDATIYLEI